MHLKAHLLILMYAKKPLFFKTEKKRKKSLTSGSKAPLKRDDSFGAQRVLGFFVNHINLFNKK